MLAMQLMNAYIYQTCGLTDLNPWKPPNGKSSSMTNLISEKGIELSPGYGHADGHLVGGVLHWAKSWSQCPEIRSLLYMGAMRSLALWLCFLGSFSCYYKMIREALEDLGSSEDLYLAGSTVQEALNEFFASELSFHSWPRELRLAGVKAIKTVPSLSPHMIGILEKESINKALL